MKVSVAMITYNHERYIAQAVESVLLQDARFDYELVIGDDASTDDTLHMVRSLAAQHPNVIRVIGHDANVGMMANFRSVLDACQGEYLAILDGDDYWTSLHKLQTQVDFLDSHTEHSLCFSRTECRVSETDEVAGYLPFTNRPALTFSDLIKYNQIATASLMFRWRWVGTVPDAYFRLKIGDWPLTLLHLLHGPGGYLPETMACYRLHDTSTFSSLPVPEQVERTLSVYTFIEQYAGPEHQAIIREARLKNHLGTAWRLMKQGSLRDAAGHIRRGLNSIPTSMWVSAFPFRLTGAVIAYGFSRLFGRSGDMPIQQRPPNR